MGNRSDTVAIYKLNKKMYQQSYEFQIFLDVWEKSQNKQKLTKLERPIKKILDAHPMYHLFLSSQSPSKNWETDPEVPDPFAHLQLHALLADMIRQDSPQGIRKLYDQLVAREKDKHEVQHKFMVVYFEWLVECIRNDGVVEDPEEFLKMIRSTYFGDITQHTK